MQPGHAGHVRAYLPRRRRPAAERAALSLPKRTSGRNANRKFGRTHGIAEAHGPSENIVASAGQEVGIDFIAQRRVSYLADKMGAGKTLQILRATVRRPQKRPLLVVCPANAVGVWLRESKVHAAGYKYRHVIGPDWLGTVSHAAGTAGYAIHDNTLVVTSYGILRNYQARILERFKNRWPHVVFDEASYMSNPESGQALASGALAQIAGTIVFADGTPEPNGYPSELWVPLRIAGLTDLSFEAFTERYCTFYEDRRGRRRTLKVTGVNPATADEYACLKSLFMIERTAESMAPVGLELPGLRQSEVIEVDADPDLDLEIIFPREFISGHLPALVQEQRDAARGITATARRFLEDKHKDELEPLIALSDSLPTYRKYTGVQKAKGAARHIFEGFLIGELQKVVVFAWHSEVLRILERELAGIPQRTISGSTSARLRTQYEEWFQSTTGYAILFGQILAARTALTLTAANVVYLVEQSFVPGHNAQAIRRILRIGQRRDCVARMVALREDPVEQHITRLLTRKSDSIARHSLVQQQSEES